MVAVVKVTETLHSQGLWREGAIVAFPSCSLTPAQVNGHQETWWAAATNPSGEGRLT